MPSSRSPQNVEPFAAKVPDIWPVYVCVQAEHFIDLGSFSVFAICLSGPTVLSEAQ